MYLQNVIDKNKQEVKKIMVEEIKLKNYFQEFAIDTVILKLLNQALK